MGCASSKQNRCIHCNNTPYSPVMPRSYSMHVHHPPQSKGDSYHVVALTSTTLGSLDQLSNKISSSAGGNGFIRFSNGKVSDSCDCDSDRFISGNKENSTQNIVEAKNWSTMIEQRLPKSIPKTPISTPPCEPETINTWELMEGLEDSSLLRSSSPNHFRSFSFDVNLNNGHFDPPKSMWLQMKQEEEQEQEQNLKKASISELEDPQVVLDSLDEGKKISDEDVVMDFEPTPFGKKKEKVIFYFTSLRGVRKTYEDCCHVRLILKGLGVRLDERDVSMHSGFKEELKDLLSDINNNGFSGMKGGLLPRVFVGRNYIGGAEEIQRLHEDGKLEKLLQCCVKIDASDCGGGGGGEEVCEACGDIKFVPCETCFGSCKIYYENNDDDDEEQEQEELEDCEYGEYGFKRCPDCNENGLIRCPICCYY